MKKSLFLFISQYRRTLLIRILAGCCARFLDCYENVNYDPHTNGELFVLKAMANQRFSCIFDVGANIGKWALMAHGIFPKAKIHCFEVIKPTCEQLRHRTKGIPNIIINDHGLSDKNEEVALKYFPRASALATMFDYPYNLEHIMMSGHVITGDSYVEEQGIEHINFLKIDVEGAENRVLYGLAGTISGGKVDVIQFEYGKVNILTKFLLRDFHRFFAARGFEVGKIYPNYVQFRNYDLSREDFRGPNYLAVRKERRDLIGLLS